jgi:ParB/RepB/Spo0J family partition protein
MYGVNPYDVIVREELRGRTFAPTQDNIIELAVSFAEVGQRQPCEVRKIAGQVELVFGFSRMAAARLLKDGFDHGGKRYHEPDFKLKVVLVTSNDEVAFIHNVVENEHRNQTSPIDDAHNQHRLRDRYMKSDEEIARLYGCSAAKVKRNERLLGLSREHQHMVHLGEMTIEAALRLLDRPESERTQIIAQATAADGKVETKVVKDIVRDHHLSDDARLKERGDHGAASSNPKPKSVARSPKQVKEFFFTESIQEGGRAALAKAILEWMEGKLSDDDFQKVWDKR